MKKILVLLYHGVTNFKAGENNNLRNYNSKHLSKTIFEDQIEQISKSCNVISTDELIKNWQEKIEYKKPTVVITFDDGFQNNFSIAKPILEKYKVPATFYISTGNITNQKIFWVDTLEIMFTDTVIKEIVPKNTPFISDLISKDIQNLTLESRDNKIKILDKIKQKLKLCHPKKRNFFLENVAKELEVEKSYSIKDSHQDYSVLSWDELKKIKSNSLFTIGGHSRWHNILSKLKGQELEEEIYGSIKDIENNLGSFSGHYAYPEGQAEHFNLETIKILKKYGVKACPSAMQGLAEKNTQNLFNFKRVMVGIDQTSNSYLKKYLNGI